MAVRIRLRRMGRKKQPHYRIVVADGAKPRDGRFVETLGYYKPLTNPARLVLDLERLDFWIGRGASPSDTVRNLASKARKGGDDSVIVGEPDHDQIRARKAEALAAKRKAETEAARAEAEEAKAAAKAEKEAAEAAAAAEAEAAAEEAAEGEEAPEASAETAAEAEDSDEAEEAPEAEASAEEEAAEAEEADEDESKSE